MIVVVGSLMGRVDEGTVRAAGTAARIALAAAAEARPVQLIGRIGDDPTADAVLLDLTRGGVGHVALLRDISHATPLESAAAAPSDLDDPPETETMPTRDSLAMDAADVSLGLRYLTGFDVLVLADGAEADVTSVVVDAARWAEARLVIVRDPDTSAPLDLPADAVAFQAPDADPDGTFAALVGRFVGALDAGTDPEEAFQASVSAAGWAPAAAD